MFSLIKKRHQGAALVEFAIILPFLLFVMAAALEMGFILMADNTLSKAVRDSTRYIARQGGDPDCANLIAQNIITYSSPGTTDIKIEPICIKTSGTLQSTYNYNNQSNSTPIEIITADPPLSCGSTDYFNKLNNGYCSPGYNLHISVTASYLYTSHILGLIIPTSISPTGYSTKYSPTLKAVSIMMAP